MNRWLVFALGNLTGPIFRYQHTCRTQRQVSGEGE